MPRGRRRSTPQEQEDASYPGYLGDSGGEWVHLSAPLLALPPTISSGPIAPPSPTRNHRDTPHASPPPPPHPRTRLGDMLAIQLFPPDHLVVCAMPPQDLPYRRDAFAVDVVTAWPRAEDDDGGRRRSRTELLGRVRGPLVEDLGGRLRRAPRCCALSRKATGSTTGSQTRHRRLQGGLGGKQNPVTSRPRKPAWTCPRATAAISETD